MGRSQAAQALQPERLAATARHGSDVAQLGNHIMQLRDLQ